MSSLVGAGGGFEPTRPRPYESRELPNCSIPQCNLFYNEIRSTLKTEKQVAHRTDNRRSNPYLGMEPRTGFEPATRALQMPCSTSYSYLGISRELSGFPRLTYSATFFVRQTSETFNIFRFPIHTYGGNLILFRDC